MKVKLPAVPYLKRRSRPFYCSRSTDARRPLADFLLLHERGTLNEFTPYKNLLALFL